MKSANTNSTKIGYDQFEVETKGKKRNTMTTKKPLKIDFIYKENMGMFISKRNLPNVIY